MKPYGSFVDFRVPDSYRIIFYCDKTDSFFVQQSIGLLDGEIESFNLIKDSEDIKILKQCNGVTGVENYGYGESYFIKHDDDRHYNLGDPAFLCLGKGLGREDKSNFIFGRADEIKHGLYDFILSNDLDAFPRFFWAQSFFVNGKIKALTDATHNDWQKKNFNFRLNYKAYLKGTDWSEVNKNDKNIDLESFLSHILALISKECESHASLKAADFVHIDEVGDARPLPGSFHEAVLEETFKQVSENKAGAEDPYIYFYKLKVRFEDFVLALNKISNPQIVKQINNILTDVQKRQNIHLSSVNNGYKFLPSTLDNQ